MAMFREIVDLIADRTGLVIGDILQAGWRPQEAPNRCVLIAESAGGATEPDLPDRADFNIQALARAETYFTARDDAWLVYQAMHGTAGWNMPRIDGSGEDYLAITIDAMSIPQYIGQDEKGRYEFSVNFIVRVQEDSCG